MPSIRSVVSTLKRIGLKSAVKKAWGRYATDLIMLQSQQRFIDSLKLADSKTKRENILNSAYFSPKQIHSELYSMLDFVEDISPKLLMEIGTARGGTLFLLADVAAKDAEIFSLDLPGGDFGGGYISPKTSLYQSFASQQQNIRLIRKDSHDPATKQLVVNVLGDKLLDFLFIDGDHTYNGVKSDFEMYGPLVKSGGYIAFHDIAEHTLDERCKVHEYWDELKTKYRHWEFIEDSNQGWGGIGIIQT